jgi:hypothetical protein
MIKLFNRSVLRTAFVAALSLLLGVVPALPQAALLPNAKQTFVDQNGNPLSNGKVYSYVPNTAVPKTTWGDSTQLNANTNPVTLDAAGRGVIYGQGSYSQKVTDSLGNQQWNAPTTAYGASAPSGATGTDTAPVGSMMPYLGLTVPVNWQLAYGQALSRTDFPDLLSAITITNATVSCTASSKTLSGFADTTIIRVGAPIEATCISTGITVESIVSSTSITVSSAAVSTATVSARIFPWGNGDGVNTFNAPDMRGRMFAGANAMGGTASSTYQVATTITTVSGNITASVASSSRLAAGMGVVSANVPQTATIVSVQPTTTVNLTTTSGSAAATAASANGLIAGMSVSGPNIAGGTTISAIVGTAVTLSINATGTATSSTIFTAVTNIPVVLSAAATASASGTAATFQAFLGANAPAASGGNATRAQTSQELVQHGHVVNDPGHVHIAGSVRASSDGGGTVWSALSATSPSANTTSSTTGITLNNTGSSVAMPLLPPVITGNYIVKVKANTTGLGGVVSIGGMFGDIICGVNITCTAQTISFSGTPILNTNHIYVGNASNQAVDVAMSGDCGIIAAGIITCTKSSGTLFGTAAFQNTGTSGANVPLLNGANTWGATNAFAAITATTLNGNTFTAGTYTLTGAASKTLTFNNSLTLSGTDAKALVLTNGLTVSGNDGTLSFGAAGKTLTINNSIAFTGTDAAVYTLPNATSTIPRVVASGAKALATGAVASATCTSAQTDAATGTLTTDAVIVSFNGDPTAVTGYVPLTTGMLTIIVYPTADTFNAKVCNNTASSITPGAITLNYRIVR